MRNSSFDVSYHFDDQLHEVPNNSRDMQSAIEWAIQQTQNTSINWKELLILCGMS